MINYSVLIINTVLERFNYVNYDDARWQHMYNIILCTKYLCRILAFRIHSSNTLKGKLFNSSFIHSLTSHANRVSMVIHKADCIHTDLCAINIPTTVFSVPVQILI